MEFFPNSRTFISIFGVEIAWYAIIILIGAGAALYFTVKDAEKRGINKDDVIDIFFGVLMWGILGARIWYVLFHPNLGAYLADPLKIIAFRDGGLAIQGGLVAGALYTYYKCRKLNINFFDLGDAALPNVLLAQAIGRWGNFVNQEAFGDIVTESYFKYFPTWFKDYMYIGSEYRQPMFFYESVFNLLGFLLIKLVLPKVRKMKRGDYIYAYLVWYGVVRFFIEHFRSDSLMFMGFKSAQVTSLIFIVIGVLGFAGLFRRKEKVNSKPLVLFDFDGTIAHTNPLILRSFEMVFNKHFPELEVTEEMKMTFIGPTLFHTFRRYLGIEDVDQYVKEYKEINIQMQHDELEEIKNATKLLKTLKNNGATLGVVSSKMRDSLSIGIELLAFDQYLSVILGGDEVKVPKPDPQGILKAMEMTNDNFAKKYYVGDTVTDVKAANAAGFTSIAIVTTPYLEEELLNCGADYVIYDLLEVLDIVKE